MTRSATVFADDTATGDAFETMDDPGPVTEETYRRVAMEDPERQWELFGGLLVEKPGMGMAHNDVMNYLGLEIGRQLDGRHYRVRVNSARLRLATGRFYIPDFAIIAAEAALRLADLPDKLEFYDGPAFLVVEVRSPSTDAYDVKQKLADYQQRGDLEIWRLQPFKHTLTIWTRQPNGSYQKAETTSGIVRLAHIPNVAIDLDRLFDVRNR